MLDNEHLELVVSGSSAKLLGREIATSLRGRSLSTEILPFSFAERLRHRGIQMPDRWPPSAELRSRYEHELRRYLEVGGFPEVQDLGPELRVRILQDYVEVVLLRDVAERHGIGNVAALRYLQRSLLSRPSNRFSIHRLFNDLRSQGIQVGKDSLYSFLEHLEDAYLLFTTHVASRSLRVQKSNPRKCYPIDAGLAAASSFQAAEDTGHLLETIVYLELRRRGFQMNYVQTAAGHEVDFLAIDLLGRRRLIQVAANLDAPSTRQRELRALEEAMAEHGLRRSTLITLGDEEKIAVAGGEVEVVPAWSWLLREDFGGA
jgi:predicted AAA+ superfamily ATPase